MKNLCAFFLLLCVLSGCDQPAGPRIDSPPEGTLPDTLPLPEPVGLQGPVRTAVADWEAFTALEERIASLYNAQGPEEMKLKLEELTADFQALEESEFPELFNIPSVRSRERVVRTFLLKTQAALYYRRDYRPALRQFLEAYNAFRSQLTRVESSQLDPSLFDED